MISLKAYCGCQGLLNIFESFCSGMAGSAKSSLEEFCDSLEEIYEKHVIEFENTDDDYKREAARVYDACTSAAWHYPTVGEGYGKGGSGRTGGHRSDTAESGKGIGQPRVAGNGYGGGERNNVCVELCNCGYRNRDTGGQGNRENPGGMNKADDLSKLSTKVDDVVDVADDLGDAAKVVDKIDDVTDTVDDVAGFGDIEGGLEPGTLSNIDARKWYLEQEAKIPNLIDDSIPLEQQVRHAFELRNQYRRQARELMSDQQLAEFL